MGMPISICEGQLCNEKHRGDLNINTRVRPNKTWLWLTFSEYIIRQLFLVPLSITYTFVMYDIHHMGKGIVLCQHAERTRLVIVVKLRGILAFA